MSYRDYQRRPAPTPAEQDKIRKGAEALFDAMNLSDADRKVLRADLEASMAHDIERAAPIAQVLEVRIVHVLDVTAAVDCIQALVSDADFAGMVESIMSDIIPGEE